MPFDELAIGRIAQDMKLGGPHRALLPLCFAWRATEDGTKTADHMALIAESRLGGDLGRRPIGFA